MSADARLTTDIAEPAFEGPVWIGALEWGPVALEDLFDAWVFAAYETRTTYEAWADARRPARGDAYAGFCAALDREERAAAVLAAAAQRRPLR